jgi:AIG2-like family
MGRPGFADQKDLIRWADSLEARSELPRLVRRLILETVPGLTDLSFAAGEGTGVGGWDGVVRTAGGTPFVPSDLSAWEISVDKKTAKKIDADYGKRTTSPDGSPTTDCAYVAVLLRRWTKRREWAVERTKEGRWRSIHAIGLDDVEMWVESAPVSHAWISERLGLGPHGLRTVETWWSSWSSATNPPLPVELLVAGRDQEVASLRSRLAGGPQITTINASSRDEALAFLAAFAILEDRADQGALMARTAIVDEVGTWRSLRLQTSPLILVANSEAVARESGGPTVHHIIVPVVGAASADIELSPIDSTAAGNLLLAAFGEKREKEAYDLARLARISLLAARRRIAIKPELLQPSWASRPVPRIIRTLLLANRWGETDGDRAAVSRLAGQPYADLREEIAKYTSGEDPFLTRVDGAVTVVSAYDAWLLLRSELDSEDLERFRDAVLEVLGAVNPALELPPGERWQANVRGRARPHSRDLREGLASSLAVLGAVGDRPIVGTTQTGVDWASLIASVLLKQANSDSSGAVWISLDDVMPSIAEAAPSTFLAAVAKGLEGEPPLLKSVFGSDDGGMFSHPTHSGLLWALELCAWSSEHFGQSIELLARLSEVDPGGRYSNRPINSLRTIFCPWYPQNAVSNQRRLDVIDALRKRHPTIAWQLMVACLPNSMDTSQATFVPRYRQWKPTESPVLVREYWEFIDGLIDRLTVDAGDPAERWPELVAILDDVPSEMRERWLDRLKAIAVEPSLPEPDRGRIWEALHGLVARHREFPDARWRLPDPEINRIAEVADLFRPSTPRIQHAWLFAEHMPSLDGVHRTNHEDYEQALMKLRAEAVTEIVASTNWDELLEFTRSAKVPFAVGLAMVAAELRSHEDRLVEAVNSDDPSKQEFARAYCIAMSEKDAGWLIGKLSAAKLSPRHHARLLLCLADRQLAWIAADEAGSEVAQEYWRGFGFFSVKDPHQLAIAARRMIDVGRAGAALDLLSLWLPEEESAEVTSAIEHGLNQFLKQGNEEGGRVPGGYELERLFGYLDRSASVTPDRIAQLEWSYLGGLEHTARRLTLFRVLSESPEFFVDLLTRLYRPRGSDDDDGEDGERAAEGNDQAAAQIAHNAWRLLNRWDVIPGTQEDGQIDPDKLRDWVLAARAQLKAVNRSEVGDIHIGHIFAASPTDPDGARPIVAIRDLIEDLAASDIEDGLRTQIGNNRGVTSRGLEDGGVQERDLSADFRKQADQLGDRWPRTSGVLRAVAEDYERDARREEEDAERFRKGLEGSGGGPLRTEESKPDEVIYFAYGSNMSTGRTEDRTGGVHQRGVARLSGHRILFNKASTDGTGKTNIVPHKTAEVWGVLFGMTTAQFTTLAGHEGGYAEQAVTVHLGDTEVKAQTFVAEMRTPGLKPSRTYLDFLIEGAREHHLPDAYIKKLDAVKISASTAN